jgi:8-oxo-dGTP diphosphatase
MAHTYEYPRPALTVDCVVFGFDDDALQLLLIRRGIEPYKGKWALPGGFVHLDEDLDAAARRELLEETGVRDLFLEQLYTFGAPNRDPRGRVVSVAYVALVKAANHPATGDTDAAEAKWFPANKIPKLAFDHAVIVNAALDRLRSKIRWQPIGFELLPEKFTLSQLQALYEAILGRPLDKRNFRKKLLTFDFVVPLDEFRTARSRPARLHRFDRKRYDQLTRSGIHFEL